MDSSNNDADYHHHHHHLHHYHHNSDYDREPAQHHHQQGQRFPFPQMLAILPIPGAILSIVGSSLIIYIALFNTKINDKNGRTSPYIRLLLGLSVCEIIYSITAALAQYLRPREDASHYYNYYYSSDWSFGTEASCNAIDFFNQFSLSTRLYYGMISFYFLLSVRFGIACIARSLEWTMHGIALGLPLISATIGAIIGLFNVTVSIYMISFHVDGRLHHLAKNLTVISSFRLRHWVVGLGTIQGIVEKGKATRENHVGPNFSLEHIIFFLVLLYLF